MQLENYWISIIRDLTIFHSPIVVGVDSPDEINSVFDTIAYSKGASVIRMMENFLGETDFRKGLTNFLTKYSFENAITVGKSLIHNFKYYVKK